MATTGILRSRRSLAQLHALASVEREIRANDHAGCRKYICDFRDAFKSYENLLTSEGVLASIGESTLVLVGDYHALPNAQQYVASLLASPALASREIILAV